MKFNNKKIKISILLFLMLIVSMVSSIMIFDVYAASTDEVDIKLTIDGKSSLDLSELSYKSLGKNYLVEVDIEIKSNSSKTELAQFSAGIINTYDKYGTDVTYLSSTTSVKGIDQNYEATNMFGFTTAGSG